VILYGCWFWEKKILTFHERRGTGGGGGDECGVSRGLGGV
jgi:hypothetical protein